MNEFQSELRKYSRYQLPVEVGAVIGDQIIQSTARDISCGGIFLTTRYLIKAGEDACVVFYLPNREKPIMLKGQSVRVEPDGVAIQFHGTSPYYGSYLDDILKKTLQPTSV